MTIRQLHAIRIVEHLQGGPRSSQRRRLATAGALGEDRAAVESVAPEAGQQQFRHLAIGEHAALIATSVEQLASASGIGAVPYSSDGERDPQRDGYYSVSDEQTERPVASDDRVQRIDISLTRAGTIGSVWRAVAANPDPVDNPFGNSAGAEIGVHADADKVRWFDAIATGAVEDATVQRTVSGERADVDIYDATEPSFSQPRLIFSLGYQREYEADVHLWDDRDRSKTVTVDTGTSSQVGSAVVGEATVGSGQTALRWQRVYSTEHDYVGTPVAETGRLRLSFDEDAGRLRAERWSESDQTYELVELGQSPWRLYDVDITHVSLARIKAQVEFEDTSASSLTTHNLNVSIKRGYDDALWTVPLNGSSPPQGLIDRLDPIAATQGSDASADMTLIERTEVDK